MNWIVTLLLATAGVSNAATYYIDYAGGNDADNGTAKSTAWKRAPGMAEFAGAYTHADGDQFIFKGGVTWPTECFQWKILEGGSSAGPDYYGADTNWHAGPAFARPVFDFERRILGAWTAGAGVLVCRPKADWITFDNLEFMRHACGTNGSTWGAATICLDGVDFITITNSSIHDWWQPNVNGATPPGSGSGWGVLKVNTSGGHNRVTGCELTQQNAGMRGGSAIHSIPWVDHCGIHHVLTAVLWGRNVSYCHIHNLESPSDPASHANAILNGSGATVHHNVIHDVCPTAMVIFTVPGQVGPGIDYIYDNVVYNVAQPCYSIDTNAKNDQGAKAYCYNNTFVAPGGVGWCIRVGYRKNGVFPWLSVKNNHFITSGTAVMKDNPAAGGAQVTHYEEAKNLLQTPAAAAAIGYTKDNEFAPADSSKPTVDAGTDLSEFLTSDILDVARPKGKAWDIGAYER